MGKMNPFSESPRGGLRTFVQKYPLLDTGHMPHRLAMDWLMAHLNQGWA